MICEIAFSVMKNIKILTYYLLKLLKYQLVFYSNMR